MKAANIDKILKGVKFDFSIPKIKLPKAKLKKKKQTTYMRTRYKPRKIKSTYMTDYDGDGVKNNKDCEPFNPFRQDPRHVEIFPDKKGFVIEWPDGREIQLLQDNPQEFYRYVFDLAMSMGLTPNPNTIQAYYGQSPPRISVKW